MAFLSRLLITRRFKTDDAVAAHFLLLLCVSFLLFFPLGFTEESKDIYRSFLLWKRVLGWNDGRPGFPLCPSFSFSLRLWPTDEGVVDFFLSPHIFPPSQPVCLARLLERLGSHASRRNRPACAVSTCSFAPSYEDALRPSLSPICDSISRCPKVSAVMPICKQSHSCCETDGVDCWQIRCIVPAAC